MMAAAKARTPLLGPSGPACAMEMSYRIHRGHKGNPLPGPGVPCPLPVPPWHRAVPHACPPLLPLPAQLCPTTPPWSWGVPVPCGLGGCPGTGRVPRGWPVAAGPHIFCTASRAQASSPSASWITPLAPPTWPGTHRGTVARLRDTSMSCWGRGHSGSRCARGHRDQPGWLLVGQCQRCQAPRGSPPPRCPQVELLGLVDLQDSAGAAIDNVTLVQCHPTTVPPGAAGMARGTWAGMVATGGRGPRPPARRDGCCSHGGWLVIATLSPAQGQDRGVEALGPGLRAHPTPGHLHGVNLGSGAGEQRERDSLGTCLLFVCLISTPSPRSPLSGQSCPATLRGACAAGTKISPVTSNGSAARGRGRAPTTPLAQVRGWLLSRGPRATQGTPQPPVPRAGMCPAHPKQPHACGESSAGTALRHLDLGWGCRWCRRSSEHPCPCPLCPGCPQHSGYFLAADPSAPWSRGQRAQLVTYRQESTTTPRCLSFWYRLAGPQIGTQPHGIFPGMPQLGSTPL